ncbi:hypothetical protein BHM03_00025523 [Ensete ventricosum]|nr:hypothetical protein BHM03_00025523 [Ensete ventricosum]
MMRHATLMSRAAVVRLARRPNGSISNADVSIELAWTCLYLGCRCGCRSGMSWCCRFNGKASDHSNRSRSSVLRTDEKRERRHEGGGHIQKTGESNDAFGNLESVLPRSASVFGAITVMTTSGGPLQEGHRKSHVKLFPSHF